MGIRPICKTTHSRSCLTSTLANKLLLSRLHLPPFRSFPKQSPNPLLAPNFVQRTFAHTRQPKCVSQPSSPPAFLAAGTSAQDLSSLLSEASSLVGTDTAYQSLLSSAASVLSTATSGLTGDAASVYSSALSAAGSEIAAATSMAGSLTSAAGSAAASATAAAGSAAATGSSTDNGVDRVVLPAMGAMGAAVLGLAAML